MLTSLPFASRFCITWYYPRFHPEGLAGIQLLIPALLAEPLYWARETPLTPLDTLNSFFLLDPATLSLGKVIIVTSQDRLDILLKVFTELAYLLLKRLLGFGFRHSVFTCLSATKKAQQGLALALFAALFYSTGPFLPFWERDYSGIATVVTSALPA
jgi:hypothetical protein